MTTHRCERARAAISLELDHELSSLELAFLERHVSGCPACMLFRLECADFTHELRRAEPERMAPLAVHTPPRRRRTHALPRQLVAAASVAALALGGLYGVAQVEQGKTKPKGVTPQHPAYLESTDFELTLLRPAHANRGTNNRVPF